MHRRILVTLALAAAAAWPAASSAQDTSDPGRFGAGVMLNVDSTTPSGGALSVGGRLTSMFGLAGAFGYAFGQGFDLGYGQLDLLLFLGEGFRTDGGPIRPYTGVGGRLLLGTGAFDALGARVPLGALYEISGADVDFFVEAVPYLDVWRSVRTSIQGAVGMRYVF